MWGRTCGLWTGEWVLDSLWCYHFPWLTQYNEYSDSTKVINPRIHVVLWYCMVCVRWLLHINVSVGIYWHDMPHPLPAPSWFCRSGHHSLWTGCRLLQRRRFHWVRPCMCSVNNSCRHVAMQSWLNVSTHCCVSGLCCGWPHRSANKCLLKVAHMSAMLLQFNKAAEIFEEVSAFTFSLVPSLSLVLRAWVRD